MNLITKLKEGWLDYFKYLQIGYERQMAKKPLSAYAERMDIHEFAIYPSSNTDPEFGKLNRVQRWGYLDGQNTAISIFFETHFGRSLNLMDKRLEYRL